MDGNEGGKTWVSLARCFCEHEAVVDILYDTKSHSFLYESSQTLHYNETNKTIHKNYNSWIRNLNVSIQRELGAAGKPN